MESTQDLSTILRPAVERMGYIYWGVQFHNYGRNSVLRIYIDHPDGVTLDDCSAVSDQISGVLDVEDAIRRSYTLEVSSPGVERLLLNNEHYELYIGAMIKVRSYMFFNNRKNFIGRLEATNAHSIVLKIEKESIVIPYSAIKQSRLLCEEWNYSEKRKNNGK